MVQIGLMLEGQAGLTWERWRRLLKAAEEMNFQCMFRSDHYTIGPPDEESLETWVSLTYAATHTSRIEFGPCVTPITFRHPALTVRMAAAVDDLSGGRLVLGMGAGWHEREHRQFGVPFYDVPTRFDMLADALEMTMRLLYSDGPVSYQGKHFSLDDAILLPRPKRPGGPPILIGGKGRKRTMPLVAKYADEWNAAFASPALFKERSALLDELLKQNGRTPDEVKRSLMTRCIIGKDDAAFQAKIANEKRSPEMDNIIAGTPSAIIDKIGTYAEAGVERFMLQWLELDDMPGIELVARDVLPHFHK